MKNPFIKSLPALVLAAAATQAQADWTLLGDAFATIDSVTLTTAYNTDDDAPFNLTGNPAVWIDTLELAAGVPFHTLDLPDEAAYEGSLATQILSVRAGDVVTFNYSFSTQETLFQDHAFVLIDGVVHQLGTRSVHPATSAIFSYIAPATGALRLSFGVVDTGDVNGVTRLSVGQLAVTAVPEPASWALLLTGAAGLVALRRRAQR